MKIARYPNTDKYSNYPNHMRYAHAARTAVSRELLAHAARTAYALLEVLLNKIS